MDENKQVAGYLMMDTFLEGDGNPVYRLHTFTLFRTLEAVRDYAAVELVQANGEALPVLTPEEAEEEYMLYNFKHFAVPVYEEA